ncbi:hypothetical protein HDU99_000520 [Rhizoclosmatium hyalinum]|nr:hypothetical protein HDU99_000520 [Rhizoclosmatium hyalinum]
MNGDETYKRLILITGVSAILLLSLQVATSVLGSSLPNPHHLKSNKAAGINSTQVSPSSCLSCDFSAFSFKNVSDVTSLDVGNCSFHQYSLEDQLNRIHNATIRKKQVWIAFYGDSMLRNPLYFWGLGRFNGPIQHPQLPTVFMCCSNISDIKTCTTSYHGDEAGDPPSIAATKFTEENNTFCASWKLIKNPGTVTRELKRLLEPGNTTVLPDLIAHNPGLWYFPENYTPTRYRNEMIEASRYMSDLVQKASLWL